MGYRENLQIFGNFPNHGGNFTNNAPPLRPTPPDDFPISKPDRSGHKTVNRGRYGMVSGSVESVCGVRPSGWVTDDLRTILPASSWNLISVELVPVFVPTRGLGNSYVRVPPFLARSNPSSNGRREAAPFTRLGSDWSLSRSTKQMDSSLHPSRYPLV